MNTALHGTTPSGINIPNRKSICHVQVVTAVTSIALLVTLALYPVAANAIDDGDFLEATSLLLKAQSPKSRVKKACVLTAAPACMKVKKVRWQGC